jgi:hypothetical protein
MKDFKPKNRHLVCFYGSPDCNAQLEQDLRRETAAQKQQIAKLSEDRELLRQKVIELRQILDTITDAAPIHVQKSEKSEKSAFKPQDQSILTSTSQQQQPQKCDSEKFKILSADNLQLQAQIRLLES